MAIIARSSETDQPDWQEILGRAIRSPSELLKRLHLPLDHISERNLAAHDFPVLVPEPFLELMEPGNPHDPLLLQVLADPAENRSAPGYVQDPLAEADANPHPGIIHKYQGRVLLTLASACAVNCRYCFRRHFAYQNNRIGRRHWPPILDYLRHNHAISEVILSGGDPLLLTDGVFEDLINELEAIPNLQRLRIHSRLPVVIPQRITVRLANTLAQTRLTSSLVLHINHPAEISPLLIRQLWLLRQQGIALLNQSVLLRGVNDSAEILAALSTELFRAGILPYYLHLLDKVQGVQGFAVEDSAALHIQKQLLANLPGYLVPRMAREEAGKPGKSLIQIEI